MTIEKMKHKLMFDSQYSGANWQVKVLTMPDSQVKAVYEKFKETGKFKKPKEKKSPFHQITIFEYLEDKNRR